MKYCESCGAKIEGNSKICPVCGAKLNLNDSEKKAQTQTRIEEAFNNFTNTANTTADFSPEDIANNKLMSVIAYLGVLVMIPLFIARESPYARYHTNQGLVLFLFSLLSYAAGFIPYIGWIIGAVISTFDLLLLIVGVLNAIKGEAKELPIIGKIKILK